MKVKITIEFDLTLNPPSASEEVTAVTPEPAQKTIEDFTEKIDRPGLNRDNHHKTRKFIYKCSKCGKVGYNARSHPDHFSEV